MKNKEKCARCGENLETDNTTGLCRKCEEYYGKDN